MDCCVCTTMPLILRPPRNTICGACYEGVRSIINMMSSVESEKVKAIVPNPNPNTSLLSRRNSSKTLEDCIRWCSEQIEQFNQQKQDLVFLRGFVAAFKAQIHTDILVNPGRNGPPIPAHKSVLAARSEIFKNMLECDECKEAPSNSITIPDLKHEELECLLEFLYSGSLGVEKLEKHVYALSQAADKYVIPHLLKHCERYLLSSLSACNALETLEIADICSNHNLKETTLDFLVKNIDRVVSSPKFEAFVHRSPHLTVQLVTRAFANDLKDTTQSIYEWRTWILSGALLLDLAFSEEIPTDITVNTANNGPPIPAQKCCIDMIALTCNIACDKVLPTVL